MGEEELKDEEREKKKKSEFLKNVASGLISSKYASRTRTKGKNPHFKKKLNPLHCTSPLCPINLDPTYIWKQELYDIGQVICLCKLTISPIQQNFVTLSHCRRSGASIW
jgi:hypothetical protein